MSEAGRYPDHKVPARALVISIGALAVPITGALAYPDALGETGALLWLLALVPAFLLAYYRGWRGVATALAFGMATLSVTQVAATVLDRAIPDLLLAIVVIYIAVSVGIGWVTELLHRQRVDVEDLALTDILTHLPNRRHARIFLENEFGAAERGRALSVILFDLDGFKGYNDSFGHQAGDEALRGFGEILNTTTRRMNLSARFGGEEFISILAGSDEEGAMIFAERVRTALRNTEFSRGRVTVSAGVAAYHSSMRSPDELIAAADLALYRAKRDGRNCVRVFGHTMDVVEPDEDSQDEKALAELQGRAPAPTEYPRLEQDIGRSRPPLTLLPHQITRFGEGKRVLLVEDETPVRALIATYLGREGFSVVEAANAIEGVSALGTEFEVVITDIRLPGSSGTELVAAVKSRWPGTQAIVITGFRDASIAAQALNAGADGYLFKPFGMPELRNHLRDALARRQRFLDARAERLHLSAEARNRADEARIAILNGAKALVNAVEVRDPYTKGHSTRVAHYSGALLDAMGGVGATIERSLLLLACELHDVGKIGVPDAILNKPAALTEAEMETVRRHPQTGRRILEPLFDDEVILAVATWHHERWDGHGYPDGLYGDAIPLPARIGAVADAFDAMTSDRAYRESLPWAEAVEQIRERAGTQFDPQLLPVFETALPAMEAIARAATPPEESRT